MNRFVLKKHQVLIPLLLLVSFTCVISNAGEIWAQESNDGMVSDTVSSLTLTPSNIAINADSCETIVEDQEFTLGGIYNNPLSQ